MHQHLNARMSPDERIPSQCRIAKVSPLGMRLFVVIFLGCDPVLIQYFENVLGHNHTQLLYHMKMDQSQREATHNL